MKRYFEASARKPWHYAVVASILLVAISVGTVAAHPKNIGGTLTWLNMQRAFNTHNLSTKVQGRVQLNKVDPRTATLENEALAVGSCYECNTFVAAYQINVISPDATGDTSQNFSIATNILCTGCYTAAWASQWDLYTNDWNQVSHTLKDAVNHMNREIDQIEDNRNKLTPDQISAKLDAVAAEFAALVNSMNASGPHAATVAPGSGAQPRSVLSTYKSTTTAYSGESKSPTAP